MLFLHMFVYIADSYDVMISLPTVSKCQFTLRKPTGRLHLHILTESYQIKCLMQNPIHKWSLIWYNGMDNWTDSGEASFLIPTSFTMYDISTQFAFGTRFALPIWSGFGKRTKQDYGKILRQKSLSLFICTQLHVIFLPGTPFGGYQVGRHVVDTCRL